ncbi:MAG TPA: trimeric intracellular cation channel family protein [Phenylobacterium sp.]|uniref:trimeric intracellular cation channel family protein n=1 Tax=Phenylobacterium sp. TaxID=1871053 RepID=UPI002D1D63BB|nr:trimeric intracellular cation channel family protein [Phenylobacterium sp.]HSV01676.1 trimeric intracellular cation channel family protein [Phenylobacterium sp.]
MDALAGALTFLDYAAVAVFGATGALAAARHKHDIVTFGFFAAVTGVGGGTLRDLLIGAPVFWVGRPAYLLVTLAAALAIWLIGWGRRGERILLWLDALGMAAYAVVGALKALSLGVPPLSALVMGVLTSTFGGIVRDVLAEEPSVLLRRELYITAALVGAATFVGLRLAGLPIGPASLAGFVLAFATRAGAIVFRWSLPGFPGRAPP